MTYLRDVMVLSLVVCLAVLAVTVSRPVAAGAAPEDGQKLVHDVYFSLKDASAGDRDALVAACYKYLKDHPGVVFFAAGARAEDLKREVNDLAFDVSLHIVFQSKADHDRYQVNEKHQLFIKENQGNWARVRVFDSYVK